MDRLSLRTCVACSVIKPRQELIRLSLNQKGKMVVDQNHQRGGRGAYVCNDECLTVLRQDVRLIKRVFRQPKKI